MLPAIVTALLLSLPMTAPDPGPPGPDAAASDCHPWVTLGTHPQVGWFCVHVSIVGIDHGCTKVAGGSRCTFAFAYNASAGTAPGFVNLSWAETLQGANGGCNGILFCVANVTGTGNLSVFVPRGKEVTIVDRISADARWLFGEAATAAEASITFRG